MDLSLEEQECLDGKHGDLLATAYRILVATGKATGADRLVPVKWAHLSGINYNTIGDAGEEFLSGISRQKQNQENLPGFKIKTTINPAGFDHHRTSDYGIDDNFAAKQKSIRESYERMGAILSFSCIPYQIFNLPKQGTHVSFAESNAAIYANSMSGLITNKESAFSALASALTGKAPYSDLRKEEFRSSRVDIKMNVGQNQDGGSKASSKTALDYGLLGYYAGEVSDSSCVNFTGIKKESMDTPSCKSLCAGLGTSGSCGMFTLNQQEQPHSEDTTSCNDHYDSGTGAKGASKTDSVSKERMEFDKAERNRIYDELNTSDTGDVIALGSPQLGVDEVTEMLKKVKDRQFKKRCMIFCPRAAESQIKKLGYDKKMQSKGGDILYDCCICFTPLVDKKNVDSVVTSSVKGAYYLRNFNKVRVNLKSTDSIIEDETQ